MRSLVKAFSAKAGLRVLIACLLGSSAIAPAFAALVNYPSVSGVFYQTSGQERPPNIGDWYTTNPSTGGGSSSTDRVHRILVEITPAQLIACGGNCSITVTDAESGGGGGDEVNPAGAGVSDPTQYSLRDRTGSFTLQGPTTVSSGALDGTRVGFSVTAAGVYQVTAVTGSRPINGDTTASLNDDDNAWGLEVEGSGTTADGTVGLLRASFQQGPIGVSGAPTINYSLYFLLGPATTDTTLALRNFDLDRSGNTALGVNYVAPNGATTTGTVSDNGVWNGTGGTLNAGADSLLADNALATTATQTGVWSYNIFNWNNENQTIFEVQAGGVNLPLSDRPITRGGNYSFQFINPPTSCANVNSSIDYTFSVTNNYFTNDFLNMTLSAVPAGWTATILNTNGSVLTNNDNINGLTYSGLVYTGDTAIMSPAQTRNFILRVTPSATAIGPYVAQINGLSYMDNRIDSVNNTIYTTSQATYVCPTIAKAFSPTTINKDGSSTMTLTLSNRNTTALTNASFTDAFPAGLINTTPLAVGGTCTGVTHTAVAGGNSFNITAATVPAASGTTPGTCTITDTVTSTANGSYPNTTSGVSGRFSGISIGPGTASNTATLSVVFPNLIVTKSSVVVSDPINGTTNPKAIPGAFVDYTIRVENSGGGAVDTNTFNLFDIIPANTELFVGDVGGSPAGPVAFTNGSPTSGLTYSFVSLATTTDRLDFSNNGGTSYTYVPVANGNGVDPAVTHLRVAPTGSFARNTGLGNPSFTARFRVRIK